MDGNQQLQRTGRQGLIAHLRLAKTNSKKR